MMKVKKIALLASILVLLLAAGEAGARIRNGRGVCNNRRRMCDNAPFDVCVDGLCEHKAVWPPLPSEVVGFTVLPLLLGLANIGGIGGGGLIIPVAMACWGFPTANAVAISNSTVFLGALLRFFGFSMRLKHPANPDKTIIDYNLASIMMPAVLLGAFSGLYLTALLPEALITIMLTMILLYMTMTTAKKMVALCRKENLERVQSHYQAMVDSLKSPLPGTPGSSAKSPLPGTPVSSYYSRHTPDPSSPIPEGSCS